MMAGRTPIERPVRWPPRSGLTLAAGLLALLGLFGRVAPALAHANLVRSDPASGAVVSTAPGQIQLWFSEQPDPHFSDVQVVDASRRRVDAGDMHPAAGDPLSLIVSLKPGLPDGLYTVDWKTVSAVDGHLVNGNLPFFIGQPPQGTVLPAATQAGPSSGSSGPTPGATLSRWLSLLSAAVLLGGLSFWPLVLLPALAAAAAPRPGPGAMARPVSASEDAERIAEPAWRRYRRLMAAAWLVLALAALLTLAQQAQTVSGVSLSHPNGAELRTLLFSSRFGQTWWLRAAATALAGMALLLQGRLRPLGRAQLSTYVLGLVAIAGVLLSYSLNSHAAASTSLTAFATIVDLFHLSTAGIWVGGLVQFAVIVPACLAALDSGRRLRLLAGAVPRFSALAAACVAILIGTGLYEAVRELPGIDALWLTGWGRTLLVKLALIVPLLLLGAVNLLYVRPALAHAAESPDAGAERTLRRRFAGAVSAEALLGVAILVAVAVLVNQPPAQAAGAATAGIHLTSKAQGVTVTLTITPGQLGPNHFEATVSVNGKPPPDGTQLVLRLTYADEDLGTTEVTTQPEGKGRYSADTSDLSTYGHWQILALVQPPQADEVRTDFTMALTQGGSSGSGSVATAATSVQRGQQLYSANCAQCHGADLHGDGPLASQLNPPPADLIIHVPQHDDQQLLGFITNGIPASAMPAFSSRLNAQDREAILNYLRNETKNETPTPTPGAP